MPSKRERSGALQAWQRGARKLRAHAYALYLAARHPQTPWYAKILAALVAAYAFSPLDLIPDPIPVLGYLDDLLLLPLGIWLTLKLIPEEVWQACQAQAAEEAERLRPRSWPAAVVIIVLWVTSLFLAARFVWR